MSARCWFCEAPLVEMPPFVLRGPNNQDVWACAICAWAVRRAREAAA